MLSCILWYANTIARQVAKLFFFYIAKMAYYSCNQYAGMVQYDHARYSSDIVTTWKALTFRI